MKLSCCAYSYGSEFDAGHIDLKEFITICRDLDLEGVELTSYYFPTTDESFLVDLKRFIFQQGMQISGTAVGGDFADVSQEARQAHIAFVKQWIDHSVVLGAPFLRVFAGYVRPGASDQETREWAVTGMRECAEYAARRGVMLGMENHHGITATWEETKQLLHAVGSPWLGLTLDCGNYSLDPYAEIAGSAKFAINVHTKTHTGSPAGQQRVDYARVVRSLQKGNYRGFLSIEYEGPDPVEEIPRFAAYLRETLVALKSNNYGE